MSGEKNIEPVFLFDDVIVPAYMSNQSPYNGITVLGNELGVNTIDEVVDGYRVVGSAKKYLAQIVRVDHDDAYFLGKAFANSYEDQVLFLGRLSASKSNFFEDFDIIDNRMIVFGANPDREYLGNDGLKNLVFGNESFGSKRVDAIKAGYDIYDSNVRDGCNFVSMDDWNYHFR